MQKRIASLLVTTLILLAACSGTAPVDEALPTLAQLPTALPSATSVPPTVTAIPSPILTDVPTELPPATALDTQPDVTDAPPEPTATLLPIPDASQPSIFPTLVAGEETTLQGQMTIIDDTHAKLTDSEGNTAIVLIDPVAAQLGANQLVQIHGTAETEGDKLVLRMSEIKLVNEATPETTPENDLPVPTEVGE
jgi:hypothetical protein